ncbi:helix-turn-helix domain-containing protein [Paenibacillus xylanexedens]|uniref:helix-turn-helix domain-containing protein n=1 Tax=Paenibacillus xylanexedens TaxID=528191 RepID=UPI0016435B49|nr:helix-turn-helix domain-containing protein [Paenibacillus xylanexedens]
MSNSYKLYELLSEAKANNPTVVLEIIKKFEPKIKKSLRQTSVQNREDLRQELVTKFIEVLYSYDININK